jgi:hypothetical protein
MYNGLNGPPHLGEMAAKIAMYQTCLDENFPALSEFDKKKALNSKLNANISNYKKDFYFEEGLHIGNFKDAFWKTIEEELHIHVSHANMIRGHHNTHNYHHH